MAAVIKSNEIEALINQGESVNLEFKTSTAKLHSVFETICAFLNNKGGTVLIGVKDNGQIVGQDVTDNTRLEIAREIKKIEPPAHEQITINYHPIGNNKFVIEFHVTDANHSPYVYDGRPYVRIESSTGLMPQHLYEQLLVQRGQLNHAWEDYLASGYTIDSLDHDEILRTIKAGIEMRRIGIEVIKYDINHILSNLKLTQDEKLINAAVVLFAKEVQPNYSLCMIRLARFRGIDKLHDFIDNQRVYGNAFKIISAAMEFADRHLPIASYFEPNNIRRIDQPAVPPLALREALINAISHRDYTVRSTSLALAIYDDRLELWNNGMLTPKLSITALRKEHESFPRNEKIASIFYKAGLIEGWGTGTTRMIEYCQKNGTPEPEFEEYSSGFSIIFRFKEPMGGVVQSKIESPSILLNSRQEKILEILKAGKALKINEILILLDAAVSLRTVKTDLAALKKLFLIEQIGKARATLWKIKV